eukprot:symbB.v1.2.004923.t1/scaffold281.1/size241006/4
MAEPFLLVLRCVCRTWDSPAVALVVWVFAALSSLAVLIQHQRLAEGASGAPLSPELRPGSLRAPMAAIVTTTSRMATTVRERSMEEKMEKAERLALATQIKIVENLVQHPNDMQYTTLWKANPIFQKAMVQSGHEHDMRKLFFEESHEGKAWTYTESLEHRAALKVASRRAWAGLEKRGFQVKRFNTYTTQGVLAQPPEALAQMQQANIATFGSPSAVRAWAQVTKHRPLAACIGGTSREAAEVEGFQRIYAPEKPGIAGWAEVTVDALRDLTREMA